MNRVILVGRLVRDPEVRYTQSGKAVTSFTLAVDKYTGQGQKEADFIPIVVWDKLAEACGNNLSKGRKVLIEGSLQIRDYENKEGQKRRIAEVVAQHVEFLERKQSGGSNASDNGADAFGSQVFPEEEIPF